jgi:hypothetical protein
MEGSERYLLVMSSMKQIVNASWVLKASTTSINDRNSVLHVWYMNEAVCGAR